MYGVEAGTGLGGLAAQAPGGNIYARRAMLIRDPGAMLIGDPTTGGGKLPYGLGNQPIGGLPQISASGTAVERPAGQQLGSWREVFDWHNSPAPWVLIALLLIYSWVHISYRRGRVSAGAGVGL